MPKTTKSGEVIEDELPSTLQRSDDKAKDTYAQAHDSALDTYDDGMGGALWSFVQTLPPKQRSVVVLRYYEQLSEAEIADVLGISVGTVKSQASRALDALRARAPHSLNPHESGDDAR